MTKKIIINIDWDGPFTKQQAQDFTNDTDYGVYQLYGRHPVYDTLPGTLLYIGKAWDLTLGARIRQHNWDDYVGSTAKCFVGRLAGDKQPSEIAWGHNIDEAEQLLIYAHAPSWNSQHINDYGIRDLHILNWGNYGQLLPEVSRDRYEYSGHYLPENYKRFST